MAEADHVPNIPNDGGNGVPTIHNMVSMPRCPSTRGKMRNIVGISHHRMPPVEAIPLDEAAKLCPLPKCEPFCTDISPANGTFVGHTSGRSASLEEETQELQSMPSKTPVSVLQELLSRRGVTPKYELVQVEGAIHEPTFRYRVSVGEILAMGTGRSKKEAKHAAAKAILEKLIGSEGEPTPVATKNGLGGPIDPHGKNLLPGDDLMMVNPIGLLQELCMSRRWPPPAYETEYEEGLPHERQFTISCVVFKHKETGTGKSKKIAKRLAAHNMWLRLVNIPQENNAQVDSLDDEDVLGRRYDSYKISEWGELRSTKIPSLTPQQSVKISQFHMNFKSSKGEKITELQEASLKGNDNFVQILQDIASEQQFEVTYIDIEEKSLSGKFQCLSQLSTMPVAVCMGTGPTSKDAQNIAALNALQYLKIMTKKLKK